MIPFKIGNYQFSPKIIPMVLTIVLVPFLASLGLWQLDRADQKRVIDDGVLQAQEMKALNLNKYIGSNIINDLSKDTYRSASLTGRYDNEHQYLLDNRTYKGRAGFHVLTPFFIKDTDKFALINRGWITYKGTRTNIPDIDVTSNVINIVGVMKQQGRAIVLNNYSGLSSTKSSYPKLIQSVQLTELADELNVDLLPIIIELNKSDKTGFVRDWQPYYGSIDKHNAYALQWFAFSAILLFLFIKLNTKKLSTKKSKL